MNRLSDSARHPIATVATATAMTAKLASATRADAIVCPWLQGRGSPGSFG